MTQEDTQGGKRIVSVFWHAGVEWDTLYKRFDVGSIVIMSVGACSV